MKLKKVIGSYLIFASLYFFSFVFLAAYSPKPIQWLDYAGHLPLLLAITSLAIFIRFLRWHWLLHRAGYPIPLMQSLLAYVAGFAFTATPGKVGELLRIRYLKLMAVPPHRVISTFLYERVFDLLVVVALASLATVKLDFFAVALLFVVLIILSVGLFVAQPKWFGRLVILCRKIGLKKLSKLLYSFKKGFAGVRIWLNWIDILLSLLAGTIVWLLVSGAFVYFSKSIGVELPIFYLFALYPLGMLVGAASMLPGGVGSTEAAIITLLMLEGVPVIEASILAIGTRVATLWFAIFLGFSSLVFLEFKLVAKQ